MSEKIERRHEWVTPNGAKFVIEEFCADGYPEHTVSIDGGDRRPLSAGLYWKIKSDSEALEAEKANTEGLPAFDKSGPDCGITVVRAFMAGMEGRRLTYKGLIGDDARN